MGNVRYLVILFVALFVTISAYGQQLKENEIVVIKGEKYILHQVRTGETIFSICRDFKIEQSQLIKNNPKISEKGLDIGEILQIPYKEEANVQNVNVKNGDPTSFTEHVIESRKETPYFIAKEYGITVEQLYAYNPEIKRFRKGTKIRIPHWGDVESQNATTENKPQQTNGNEKELVEHLVLPGETLYSIARQFNVAVSEILFFNPEAKELKAGSKIMIPLVKKENNNVEETNLPVNTESSSHYFEHVIESGETMWGITHKYNVTDKELIALNPVLETGFPAGVEIKIPVHEITTVNPDDEDIYSFHKVEPEETLYGLAQKYHVSIDDIKRSNPVLANRGPVIGETLLIPKQNEQPVENNEVAENTTIETESAEPVIAALPEVRRTLEVPASCIPRNTQDNNRIYSVSLFLPLYLEANDTLNREIILPEADSLAMEMEQDTVAEQDTIVEKVQSKEMFKKFYGNSENFLQFYEGVLIAIDSLQKTGMNVILHVFDTQNNVDSTRAFIQTPAFRLSDLIIGPVYQETQKEVANAAASMRIPMVSPVASSSNVVNQNPYFFQVNPSREYLAEKTAEMVVEDYYNCNFIVVQTSNNDQNN